MKLKAVPSGMDWASGRRGRGCTRSIEGIKVWISEACPVAASKYRSGYHFMSSRVHCYMRWSPKARNRLLDRQFMVPTIRTIIADDEALARQKLRILLTAESGIHIVTECKNSRETAGALQAHKPDLLLLDVQMPDADGFEVNPACGPEEMPMVIFTTAYDHYA